MARVGKKKEMGKDLNKHNLKANIHRYPLCYWRRKLSTNWDIQVRFLLWI